MHGADMHVRKTCVILALPVARSFMNSMISCSKDWTVHFIRSIARR
jgi:hypothetical protein